MTKKTPRKAARAAAAPAVVPITAATVVVIPNHAEYMAMCSKKSPVSGGVTKTFTPLMAPFGTLSPGCALNRSVKTDWPILSTLTVEKKFTLSAGAHNFRVQLSIDNNAEILLNGTPVGSIRLTNCPSVDEVLVQAPVGLL